MLKEYKDEASLKAAGKVMTKGKDYGGYSLQQASPTLLSRNDMLTSILVVADGDIILSTHIWNLKDLSQSLIRSQSKPVLQSHDRVPPHAGRVSTRPYLWNASWASGLGADDTISEEMYYSGRYTEAGRAILLFSISRFV